MKKFFETDPAIADRNNGWIFADRRGLGLEFMTGYSLAYANGKILPITPGVVGRVKIDPDTDELVDKKAKGIWAFRTKRFAEEET